MSATMTTVVEPSKAGDRTETHAKPEIGLTGRKIVYDKDGKPYVRTENLKQYSSLA